MYLVKRNKLYHLYYKNEMGKLISHSTKCSKKAEAQKYMLNYFSKSQGEEITMQPYTYTNFKVFYLDYASARFSKSYQAFVKIALSQFEKVVDPGTEIGKVTSLDVESFISMKRKLVKERIINGYLITLQSAFERAVEFKMLKTNVFRTIKKLKAPNNPPLFLSKDEMDTLLSHEDEERFRVIYRFAAYTGMRMGEIRFLRWRSIDFTKDLISVSNHEEFTTKSKKSRDIPLHPCLREDLLKLKGNPDDYIFLYDKRQYTKDLLSRNFKEAIRRAKLNDKYHFHTLRHTFASWLVQKGVSIYEVSKLLGHADIKTTEIYAHLKENNLRSSVNLL